MRKTLKFLFLVLIFVGALGNLLRPFREYFVLGPWGWFVAKIIFALFGILVTVIFGFVAYRILTVRSVHRQVSARRSERVQLIYDALDAGRELMQKDIIPFAEDVGIRWTTYQILRENGLDEIFPKEFYNIEHAAESKLAEWLESPNELGALPDELEHATSVTINADGKDHIYHVFRFRVNEPHWAASRGWMLGIVGPYFVDSEPYDWPAATFSTLEREEDITPVNEANWAHENFVIRYRRDK